LGFRVTAEPDMWC